MAQGQRLTDRQIETIRLAYAETGSQREAARRAKCAVSAVKKYIAPVIDDLEHLRTQKKADIIEEIAAVRLVLLAAMKSPAKLDKASMAELATSFGILTDKHQILTGGVTARTEQTSTPIAWSDDEVSALASLAERVKASRSPS
jgi:hypothetical protein